MGNITSASQSVSNLSNGTSITNSYAYDSGDRLSRITHNGFNYYFGYTEFGLLKSIKAGSKSLINYGYDNEGILTSASYGNGQTVNYEYNDDKNKATVKQDGTTLYGYNYDDDGVLTSVNDNVSDRVTSYLTNSDGQDIIEETGSRFYHKYYATENKKVETIDDSTKTTYINENDDSTVITYNTSYTGSGATTHEKNTDKFGRTTNEKVVIQGKAGASSNVYNKEYSYMTIYNGNTTDKVSKITYTGAYNKTLRYGYDGCGYISEVNDIWYLYDEAGQLTREVNIKTNTGKNYVYDKGGNITEVQHFKNGEYGETDKYTYGNSNWKDLLTEYNGNKITYDEIGNPLTYYNGMEFSWTMGRRLESVTKGKSKTRYTYNADGLRTSKIINGTSFNYYWNGDKLTAQTWPGFTLYFYYDNDGNPIGFDFNDKHYDYITNLQGDIIAIVRGNKLVAEYEYDAWGNCTILRNTDNIANTNPLRYRGYYYDTGTNLYYLQSRYYDANIGRFINSDKAEEIADGEINLFRYCENNPVNYIDPTGEELVAFIIGSVVVATAAIVCTIISTRTLNQFYSNMDKVGKSLQTAIIKTVDSYKAPFVGIAVAFKTLAKSVGKSISKVKSKPKYKSKREYHHIVAQYAVKAAPARSHLSLAGLSTSAGANLVWLKTGLHRRLHTNGYYNMINNAISGAYARGYKKGKQKQYIINTLLHISKALTAMSNACPF